MLKIIWAPSTDEYFFEALLNKYLLYDLSWFFNSFCILLLRKVLLCFRLSWLLWKHLLILEILPKAAAEFTFYWCGTACDSVKCSVSRRWCWKIQIIFEEVYSITFQNDRWRPEYLNNHFDPFEEGLSKDLTEANQNFFFYFLHNNAAKNI